MSELLLDFFFVMKLIVVRGIFFLFYLMKFTISQKCMEAQAHRKSNRHNQQANIAILINMWILNNHFKFQSKENINTSQMKNDNNNDWKKHNKFKKIIILRSGTEKIKNLPIWNKNNQGINNKNQFNSTQSVIYSGWSTSKCLFYNRIIFVFSIIFFNVAERTTVY